ncbi:hypothetical protein [cyanobacterium endosymbiont of Epithemia turgida]|uniref:hypothetical protein n=1 Tax=cyanobacterium endosymbiont of Epithemia turgida TaxID=718217 RepID=UPI0004D15066|nr:hypothetical protein [cyanobacterium endosymbiont of Epithemia turgida]BAP17758.1 hypothetical protein ETSB_0962 [cyanobacterium endosymbiont of Epithemia turgida isolate EtSB Lake Yunoko]
MLSQIVRPLVQTQIRLLANSQATQATLVDTITRWLSYLGVRARVTQLSPHAERIHVCLTVAKPDLCDAKDWQQILKNLRSSEMQIGRSHSKISSPTDGNYSHMNDGQQLQLSRLLAYLIQVGIPKGKIDWHEVETQLSPLKLDQSILISIKSALKVPQSSELLKKLDPDVAASVFPLAVRIAWLDQEINSYENNALIALLAAMK